MLAPWRDLAIVYLALLAAIFAALPGIALWYAVRGVRALKRWVRVPLLRAQIGAVRVQQGVLRASEMAIALPVAVESAQARARATARGLIDFLRGR